MDLKTIVLIAALLIAVISVVGKLFKLAVTVIVLAAIYYLFTMFF